MNKKFLSLIILLIAISAFGAWFYISNQKREVKEVQPSSQEQNDVNQSTEKPEDLVFTALATPPSPSFITPLSNAKDVKIDFHYEGDYAGSGWASESEFYTPEGSNEKFLSLSKTKKKEGQYIYGPDYYPIFTAEESHSYQGTPIYLLNPDSKYSVSYVGFKIDNSDLVGELKIEFGIDYFADRYDVGKSKSSIFASIFRIESVYACGPGIYLRNVGDSKLNFVQESNGVVWYKLEKPVALYNLNLSYCNNPPEPMPSYCHFWADDPPECWEYCEFNASISDFKNGNLRMHVLYKPNDKEGFLKIQMVNLILSDSAGTYYQPNMGKDFDHYYRAYLR